MLLKAIYPKVVNHITNLVTEDNLIKYTANIAALDRYKSGKGDLKMRVAWDMLHSCYSPAEICKWYDLYGCNDTHITTLIYKVIKDNYPAAYNYIQKVTA